MSLEPTSFAAFGIKITSEEIIKITDAFKSTYTLLEKTNEKWTDIDFCKRQIVSLWGAISDSLKFDDKNRFVEKVHKLVVDDDNTYFLKELAIQLKEKKVMDQILSQINELKVREGSIRFNFTNLFTKDIIDAHIDPERLLKYIKKQRSRIETSLRHFVESIKKQKDRIITALTVAGLVVICLTTLASSGVNITDMHLIISSAIALICLIAEVLSTSETLAEFWKSLHRRVGIRFIQI